MNFTANFYTIKGFPVELEMSTGQGEERDEALDSKGKTITQLLAEIVTSKKLEKKGVYFFDGEFSFKGGKLEAKEIVFQKTDFTPQEFKKESIRLKKEDARVLESDKNMDEQDYE
jgi:hypothetical protein